MKTAIACTKIHGQMIARKRKKKKNNHTMSTAIVDAPLFLWAALKKCDVSRKPYMLSSSFSVWFHHMKRINIIYNPHVHKRMLACLHAKKVLRGSVDARLRLFITKYGRSNVTYWHTINMRIDMENERRKAHFQLRAKLVQLVKGQSLLSQLYLSDGDAGPTYARPCPVHGYDLLWKSLCIRSILLKLLMAMMSKSCSDYDRVNAVVYFKLYLESLLILDTIFLHILRIFTSLLIKKEGENRQRKNNRRKKEKQTTDHFIIKSVSLRSNRKVPTVLCPPSAKLSSLLISKDYKRSDITQLCF
uniref:Uncharacterized protein n=1 Tax=Glossina austeni TaxID=7395 RepID=A0A1A9VBK4_GLOAU